MDYEDQIRPWDEVQEDFARIYPNLNEQERRQRYQHATQMAQARLRASDPAAEGSAEMERLPRYLLRRTPIIGSVDEFLANRSYGSALQRLHAGTPHPADYGIIANHEYEQQQDQSHGDLANSLSFAPRLAGEAYLAAGATRALGFVGGASQAAPTGASILSREGATQLVRQAAARFVSPSAWGQAAVGTAFTPSLWLPGWPQRNMMAAQESQQVLDARRQIAMAGSPGLVPREVRELSESDSRSTQDILADTQRDPLHWRGLANSFVLGTMQNMVLGNLSGAASEIPGRSVGAFATRGAVRVGAGLAEQQVMDVIAGTTGLQTGYGIAGDLYHGRYGEAAQHAIVQAATFAAFAGLHEIQEPRDFMNDTYLRSLRELRRQGLSASEANSRLGEASNLVFRLSDAPDSQAREAINARLEGPAREYGLELQRVTAKTRDANGQPRRPMSAAELFGDPQQQEAQGPQPGIDELSGQQPFGRPPGAPADPRERAIRQIAEFAGANNQDIQNEPVSALEAYARKKLGDQVFESMLPGAAPFGRPGTQQPATGVPAPEQASPVTGRQITPEMRAESMWDGATANGRRAFLGGDPNRGVAVPGGEPTNIGRTKWADLTDGQRQTAMRGMGFEPSVAQTPEAAPEARPKPKPKPLKVPMETGPMPPGMVPPGIERTPFGRQEPGAWRPAREAFTPPERPLTPEPSPPTPLPEKTPFGKSPEPAVDLPRPNETAPERYQRVAAEHGLTERETKILLERAKGRTFEDIGKELGVKKQAIQQAEKKILDELGVEGSITDVIHKEMNAPEPRSRSDVVVPETMSSEGAATVSAEKRRGKPTGYGGTPTEQAAHLDGLEKKLTALYSSYKKELRRGELTDAGKDDYQRRFRELDAQIAAAHQEIAPAARAASSGVPPANEAPGQPPAQGPAPSASPEGAAGASAQPEPPPSAAPEAARPQVAEPMPSAESRAPDLVGGGQENLAQPFKRESALANAKIEADRKLRGEPPILSEARKTNAEVWDRAMALLDHDPGLSARLVDELAAKPRATTVEENALLLHREVQLKNEYAKAAIDGIRVYKDKASTPEQMVQADQRMDAARADLNKLEQVARQTGTEWGRAGQFRRQLVAEDFSLGSMLRQAEAAKKAELTKDEIAKITEQSKKIEALNQRIAELEAKQGDKPNPFGGQVTELTKVKAQQRTLQQEFLKDMRDYRESHMTFVDKAFHYTREGFSLIRAIKTGFDLSAVLRQGGWNVFAHPIKSAKAFGESVQAARSPEAAAEYHQAINERPNAYLYERSGLHIAESGSSLGPHEEAFMSRYAEKIPLLAASERAYVSYLNRIRADVFDAMITSISRNGKVDLNEAKVIADYVNASTGRGKFPQKFAEAAAAAFFSPRYFTSRVQLLIGEPLWWGNKTTRMAVAKEYGRFLVGIGVMYGLAKMWDDKSVNFDPRSSDFGKIKVGDVRVDPLAGLSQHIVFASRMASGQSANTQGRVHDLFGPNRHVRDSTGGDVIGTFVRSKLAPIPGAGVDVLARENMVHEPTTLTSFARNNFLPMVFNDVYDSMTSKLDVPAKTTATLLAILGAGVQNHEHHPRQQVQYWPSPTSRFRIPVTTR